MTNDQFPSAGESFPGMIDPIITWRPCDFERISRFARSFFANRWSRLDDKSLLEKIFAHIAGFYGTLLDKSESARRFSKD